MYRAKLDKATGDSDPSPETVSDLFHSLQTAESKGDIAPVDSPNTPWSLASSDASRVFQRRIENFTTGYANLWRTAPGGPPRLEPGFSPGEQAERESRADRESEQLKARLRQFPGRPEERAAWRANLLERARQMAGRILNLDGRGLRLFFTAEGLEATQQCVNEARNFDPKLSEHSLHQALRNLWVMQSIQLLLQRPVALTPPVFGYSMLYPFTDNYLDDPDRSAESKWRFCEWLGLRLRDHRATPPDSHAAKVGRLIARIEATFPRAEFEEVYLSLAAIHAAQTDSLRQLNPDLAEDDLLELTVRKGGTSVLADAYLVAGQLSEAEARFMFGYGVLLQLMDDLQDFADDLASGHDTLFARQAAVGHLDELTSKFWQFSEAVLWSVTGFEAPVLHRVKALLRDNCKLLLLQTVARNPGYYSAAFSENMEACSPFSFSYMAKRQTTLHKEYSAIVSRLQHRGEIERALDFLN